MAVFSINGVICDAGKATISVMDHGFLYGDGVFEGLRFYRQKILKLSAHLYRLKDSATALGIELPVTLEEIKSALDDVIRASAEKDGYIRLIVTRGVGPLGIDPRQCKPGSLVIIADKLSMMSQAVLDQGAKLIIAGTRRYSPDQLDSRIKSLNYLNQIQGRIEANAAGADEAVLLNQAGFVAEGTADNLFIVRNGVLLTPPVKDGALDGITRGIILELAEQKGIPIKITSLAPFDLYTADECFLTGTGAELIPVREISARRLPHCPGPVYQNLLSAFHTYLKSNEAFL